MGTLALFGYVVGHFVLEQNDSADPGVLPDEIPLSGDLTFISNTPKVAVVGAVPSPTTVYFDTFKGALDANGNVIDANGNPGIWLPATNDPADNPSGFNYTVKATFRNGTAVIANETYVINVPVASATDSTTWTDLTKAAPIASSGGIAITQGPPGPAVIPTIGTVTQGSAPGVTISNITTNPVGYSLNFVIPIPPIVDDTNHVLVSALPNLDAALPPGMLFFSMEISGTYQQRPTTRPDQACFWIGPDTPPVASPVNTGTAGMYGIDHWFQTVS
ncbi:hypothetical protein ACFRFH_12185 [Leifsonia sp. NPDC056824]|uniref:hypothetical protein n=1 Tax=Leifsonia sp. NPDC056824 TaxID=3345953 RepID=UPI0036B58586